MKTELMRVRITDPEKEAFQKAADLSGVALSAWARERLRGVARRELIEAGLQVPFLQEKARSDG
jgi:hypothetical protein